MAHVYEDDDDEDIPPPPPSYPHPDDVKAAALDDARAETHKANDMEDGQSYEIPPTPVVHRMTDAEDNAKFRSWSRNAVYTCIIAVFILLIAIILGVGFGTGSFLGGKSSSAPPPSTEEATPSPVPITGREQAFVDYLSTVSVNGSNSFEEPKSGEALALQWLANNDTLMLDPTDPDSQQRINQRYALASLFYASDAWNDETNWLNEDECTWVGVSCTSNAESQGRRRDQSQGNTATPVLAINLTSNSYSGTLPVDISLLTSLTSIDLSTNDITGDIASINWANFGDLIELDVSGNLFSGSLGTRLFQVTTLETLILSKNPDLVGSIPSTIGNLVNLQVFTADSTGLKGSIPSSIGLVQKLVTFDISSANVSGSIPTEIGNLQNLLVFAADENSLRGTIPSEVSNMKSLVEFRCHRNELSGSINGIFGGLSNLRKFHAKFLSNLG